MNKISYTPAAVRVHARKHTHARTAHGDPVIRRRTGRTYVLYVWRRYSSCPVPSVCFKRRGEVNALLAYRRRMQPPPPTHYRFRRSTPASRAPAPTPLWLPPPRPLAHPAPRPGRVYTHASTHVHKRMFTALRARRPVSLPGRRPGAGRGTRRRQRSGARRGGGVGGFDVIPRHRVDTPRRSLFSPRRHPGSGGRAWRRHGGWGGR